MVGCALLILGLQTGCQLPANTAIRDWGDIASVAVEHATMTGPGTEPRMAISQALAIHFFTLAVLADGGPSTFQEDAYGQLVLRAAVDPAHATALASMGRHLAQARDDAPLRGQQADLHGTPPVLDDRRLETLLRDSDPTLQELAGALALEASPEARQVLMRLGEGHAMMARAKLRLRQQETLRQVRVMEAQLRRAVEALPTAPEAGRDHLAEVLLP